MDGRVFHQGTDEYKDWYDGKLDEYKNLQENRSL